MGSQEYPPKGYIWKALPSLSELKSSQKVLLPNDFPYYLQDGIEHWCLWKLKEKVTEEDIRIAKEELKELAPGTGCSTSDVSRDDNGGSVLLDTIHWINPPHLKSIPDIDHAH